MIDGEKTLLTPTSIIQGHRFKLNTTIVESNFTDIYKYTGIIPGQYYIFNAKMRGSLNNPVCCWADANDVIIKIEQYQGKTGQTDVWRDVEVQAPEGASQFWMNVDKRYSDDWNASYQEKKLSNLSYISK
jgi:hypothetical protein